MTSPMHDEIVEEIRRRREAHARSLDFDVRRIIEDLQRRETESGVELVTRPPRKPVRSRRQSSA